MKKGVAWIVVLLFWGVFSIANAHTREAVRARYHAIPSEATEESALMVINFMRWLAGVRDSVVIDEARTREVQMAAELLAQNDVLTHTPACPPQMEASAYQLARHGAENANIISFNWADGAMLTHALDYFMRDDDAANRTALGHRRWLLHPELRRTGFGTALSATGNTYIAVYVTDLGDDPAGPPYVAWPSPGAFPAEYMHRCTPWSISLEAADIDWSASRPTVLLTEAQSGERYVCSEANGQLVSSRERYGNGPCLIVQPPVTSDYHQNQVWDVRVEGMVTRGQTPFTIEYTVRMISLTPIAAVNVELSANTLTMAVGESVELHAYVVPVWADDLSVVWRIDAADVAAVSSDGGVTALSPGTCWLSVTDAWGHVDHCTITVIESP